MVKEKMGRIVENREILMVLLSYLIVQLSVIALAYYIPRIPSGDITTPSASNIAESAGIPAWQIALGYGLWIALSGTIVWFVIRNWKYRDVFIRLAEGFFIAGGTASLFLLYSPMLGFASYLPGIALAVAKNLYPRLRNITCLIASSGVALLLASQFNFPILVILLCIIGIYDFVAVRITKHMIPMAMTFDSLNLALLISFSRKVSDGIYSTLKLGGGDLIFPAALSAALVIQFHSFFTTLGVLCLTVGSALALLYLTLKIRQTQKGYPAIPYLIGGIGLGAAAFLIGVNL